MNNPDVTIQRLSVAIRFVDHFSDLAIEDELEVGLTSREDPVLSPSGRRRHSDGSYRWANLVEGLREITVRSAPEAWTRWTSDPIRVAVPTTAETRVPMWPTPRARVPDGVTAIRGKLVGNGADLRVAIDSANATTPRDRWTRSDAQGEFLYFLSGGPWAMTADGFLDLDIVVANHNVTRVDVGDASFAGSQFLFRPGGVRRVHFHVT